MQNPALILTPGRHGWQHWARFPGDAEQGKHRPGMVQTSGTRDVIDLTDNTASCPLNEGRKVPKSL